MRRGLVFDEVVKATGAGAATTGFLTEAIETLRQNSTKLSNQTKQLNLNIPRMQDYKYISAKQGKIEESTRRLKSCIFADQI